MTRKFTPPNYKGLATSLSVNINKLFDIVTFYIAKFLHEFDSHILPSVFEVFFIPVNKIHYYSTRVSTKQSCSLPKAKTNYGIHNIIINIWNSLN